MKKCLLVVPLLFACAFACAGADTPPEPNLVPRVFFVTPGNGEVVIPPIYVQLGVANFVLESPGEARDGHGYLVIGLDVDCLQVGQLFPFDERYVHIQNGTAEAILDLSPGPHDLCLQASDGEHRALAPTEKITIVVE